MDLTTLLPAVAFGIFGLLAGVPANQVVHRLPKVLERQWSATEGGVPPITIVPTNTFTRARLRLCALCLLSAAVAAAASLRFGISFKALAAYCFGLSLIVLAFIDAETGFLPDLVTLPLAIAGLAVNGFHTFVPLSHAFVGMVFGAGALWLVRVISMVLQRREGMGAGDLKLLGAVGAWTGFHVLPQVMLVSFVGAALYAVGGALRGAKVGDDAMPFGPFLALASMLAMFGGFAPV